MSGYRILVNLWRVFALTLATSYFSIGSAGAAGTINWEKYCKADGSSLLLFVDITTPYDAHDKQILVDGFQRIVSKLEGGDRIVIRTITDSYTSTERLLSRCVPYCPPASFWEELFSSCTGGLILNEKRALLSEIGRVVRTRLDEFQELPHSDILKAITFGVREELGDALNEGRGSRLALYVFSDLIENSEYIPGKRFSTVSNSELLAEVRTDGLIPVLRGASVHAFGVGRGGGGSRNELPVQKLNKIVAFWTAYFQEGGAAPVTISQNFTVQ